MAGGIIVTGCASGIGLRLADELYRRGRRVLVSDIDEARLRTAVEQVGFKDSNRFEIARLDVRDPGAWGAAIARVVERWGRLDVLMNVAGCLIPGWAHEATHEQIDRVIDVNVKGVIHGTRAALAVMIPVQAGHVVNVGSLGGVVPIPGNAIYSASKHAVRAYSIATALETRKHGVYVSVVCPAVVDTPMMDAQLDREECAVTFSSKRALTVEEVAEAIIDDVLPNRPLERTISTYALETPLCRLGNAFPNLLLRFSESTRQTGRKNQEKYAKARENGTHVSPKSAGIP